MRFYPLLTALLIAALLLGGSPAVAGELSGRATLGFSVMRGEAGGEVVDGRSFTQQYSFLYSTNGLLNKGRAGAYRFDLGGEWNILDAKVNDVASDIETTKILYRGEVVIAPGGLPFRLRLFSYDMQRSSWDLGGAGADILTPRLLFTDINNGQHIRTGATLLVGIRNGSYLGRYRDFLSAFPRLLMDYSEERVRDLHSRSKKDFRSRDLAFVSLNKKDNWFHFRYHDHQDYLEPDANFTEKQHMLGTVDHELVRRWINLTNWLKLSADGSYTVREEAGLDEEEGLVSSTRRSYDLHLFTLAERHNWKVGNFTTFRRERTEEYLDKKLAVPLFANGEFNRNTAWRFRFAGSGRRRMNTSGTEVSSDELFVSGRIDTFRQRRVVVSPSASLLALDGYTGKGVGAQLGIEIHSQKRFRPRIDWYASYRLTVIDGISAEGESSDLVANAFVGSMEMALAPSLRAGLTESLAFAREDSGRFFMSTLEDVPRAGTGEGVGSFVRSTTKAFLEHRGGVRLRNRYELGCDYVSTADDSSYAFEATHRMNYEPSRRLRIDWQSMATYVRTAGAGGASATFGTGTDSGANVGAWSDLSLLYSSGSAWEASLRGRLDWLKDRETSIEVRQGIKYRIMKVNGIVRKLAELSEEIAHERSRLVTGKENSVTRVTLAGSYYPTHVLFVGTTLEAEVESSSGDEEYVLHLRTGLTYSQLKLAMDYGYGTHSGDNLTKRKEHLFEVELTKTF